MKISILAPLVAMVLMVPANATACSATPPGQQPQRPPGGVVGAGRQLEFQCNMYDQAERPVHFGIIAEGAFTKVKRPWPQGPQHINTPLTAILNIEPGTVGVAAHVTCTSGGLPPNWKFECVTRLDGVLIDRDIELGGARGIPTVVDVVCEYIGP